MNSQDSRIEGSGSEGATQQPDPPNDPINDPTLDQRPEESPPINAEWQDGPPSVPQRVVLKFRERIGNYDDDDAGPNLPEDLQIEFANLQNDYPSLRLTPLFGSVDTDVLEDLSKRPEHSDSDYVPPDFLTYYAVELPTVEEVDDPGTVGTQVAELFANSGLVESAYLELPPGPQPCDTAIHHNAVPDSLGASLARILPGGDGAGARLLDLERVWDTPPHPDLGHVNLASGIPPQADYPPGYNYNLGRRHATAVAGIIAAPGGGVGCIGIAPAAEMWLGTTWRMQSNGKWYEDQAAAILAAIPFLNPGDVLLLEMQVEDKFGNLAPVELNNAAFDAIKRATEDNIIVIEPAGNGGMLLTDLVPGEELAGAPNRFQSGEHSGAVLVAATMAPNPGGSHWRQNDSNFGGRIDCHAWGEKIETLDTNNHAATIRFGLTSGASAMIAGAALVVQGMRLANQQPPLTPPQMADLLRSGTPMEPPAIFALPPQQIAAMPDLVAIHSNL